MEAGQTPFTIDHSNILFPVANVVTPELFKVGVVTEEPPAITDQVPIPTKGAFALMVVVGEQIIWLTPADEIVGRESTKKTTVSGEFGQVPKAVVHTKVLTPLANPVTDELLRVVVTTEPPPLRTDQVPNPIVGVLPFNVAVDAHIV